ncbi:MAG TPA: hypothetical protein VGQ31_00540, partial [Candidatus Limnocylindrales bacterium]|nr:hypothetical protein [Candidatus Limnocylindrales bacterium]
MSVPTRVAGWGIAADGSEVTWTVAEGRRGRRWREVISRDLVVVHALLLETAPDGRFSHLELARADGLWTFHPEPDGTLHGNHVGRGEVDVRHVTGWPFGPDDALLIEDSAISLAAIAWARTGSVTVGGVVAVEAVVIGGDGALEPVPALRVERLTATGWRVGDAPAFELDPAGLPVLDGGSTRPL